MSLSLPSLTMKTTTASLVAGLWALGTFAHDPLTPEKAVEDIKTEEYAPSLRFVSSLSSPALKLTTSQAAAQSLEFQQDSPR